MIFLRARSLSILLASVYWKQFYMSLLSRADVCVNRAKCVIENRMKFYRVVALAVDERGKVVGGGG